MQAGGLPSFNQDFCNKNNGYSKGTIVQGDDPNRPWVLWQCLEDNNRFNPNQNKVNIINPQNGWIRYPVISEREGNTLYYNDDGKMLIASPTVITEIYVSSSIGNDETGNGSYKKPFFSIVKAISVTPPSGGVTIYLKAGDSFYLSPNGKIDSVIKDGPTNYYVSNRFIDFRAYDDPELDKASRYMDETTGDWQWAVCVTNINRPKIILLWNVKTTVNENGQRVLNGAFIYGLAGTDTAYKLNFFGMVFDIDDVDGYSNVPSGTWGGFIAPGTNILFQGCIFNNLPNVKGKWIAGGGQPVDAVYLFKYRNLFLDNRKGVRFFSTPSKWNISASEPGNEQPFPFKNSPYRIIKDNVMTCLGRNSVFNDTIEIINNPAPSYKNLTTNFQIDMDG